MQIRRWHPHLFADELKRGSVSDPFLGAAIMALEEAHTRASILSGTPMLEEV